MFYFVFTFACSQRGDPGELSSFEFLQAADLDSVEAEKTVFHELENFSATALVR